MTLGGFSLRWLLATVLVLATYNPSGYSALDWFRGALSDGTLGPEHYLCAVVILIGWVIMLRATFNSLGTLGLVLGTALLATFVWFLIDLGLLSGSSFDFYAWIALICLGALLALGLAWSHLWRRLTGQVDVEDFDGSN
ncbi:MAG: hypothetical protein HC809_11640 [Gammaproteobacteria bacterium]|nr:hypothetical protein [Gammaproteobacteria bacterium]